MTAPDQIQAAGERLWAGRELARLTREDEDRKMSALGLAMGNFLCVGIFIGCFFWWLDAGFAWVLAGAVTLFVLSSLTLWFEAGRREERRRQIRQCKQILGHK